MKAKPFNLTDKGDSRFRQRRLKRISSACSVFPFNIFPLNAFSLSAYKGFLHHLFQRFYLLSLLHRFPADRAMVSSIMTPSPLLLLFGCLDKFFHLSHGCSGINHVLCRLDTVPHRAVINSLRYKLMAAFKTTTSRFGPFRLPDRIFLVICAFSSGVPPMSSSRLHTVRPNSSGVIS